MMDYAAWRKRPPAPPLQAFLEARRPQSPPPAPEPEPPAPAPPAPHDEMVAAARQEAYVAGRVAELARAGLWTERRLPRVLEPPRPKSHWDYLLEEMAWLAQDFAHERKWKKQAAKKVGFVVWVVGLCDWAMRLCLLSRCNEIHFHMRCLLNCNIL